MGHCLLVPSLFGNGCMQRKQVPDLVASQLETLDRLPWYLMDMNELT